LHFFPNRNPFRHNGVSFFFEAISHYQTVIGSRVAATAADSARAEAADKSMTICWRDNSTMEVSMPARRMHKGRVMDIFVRQAEGRGPVAIRVCSRFVLAIVAGLIVSGPLSGSIQLTGGLSVQAKIEYDWFGSRVAATAADSARAEAADKSMTICWRRSCVA
jgi:hypothetical protein